MFHRISFLTISLFLIGLAIAVAFGVLGEAQSDLRLAQQEDPAFQPEIKVRQLEKLNGVIPVEILSPDIRLTSVSTVNGVSFNVRNNSDQEVRAFCLAYTISVSRNSSVTRETFFQTVETFLHPDFAQRSEFLKPVAIGAEKVVTDPAVLSFGADSFITGIEIWLDYVEFEDGTKLGTNKKGEYLVTLIRTGADNYASWLRDQYRNRTITGDSLKSLIELEQLPASISVSSSQEKQGAFTYRNHLRRISDKEGTDGLADFISRHLITN